MGLTSDQRQEIELHRSEPKTTLRATSPGAENLLYKPFEVLDHGFVRMVDYMGDDEAIVQAARTSYGKGTKLKLEDEGLIRYLMRHRHSTPFEMNEVKLHVCCPILVARQWMRHRMASINEYSARYSIMAREFYVPEPAQLAAQSVANRQGRSQVLEGEDARRALEIIRGDANRAFDSYEDLLNEDEDGHPVDPGRTGLARELARIGLPVSTYTQFYWKIDIHNLLHFLGLRADSHAQYEIRVYAQVIEDMIEAWLPATFRAYVDYRKNAFSMSGPMMALTRRIVAGEKVDRASSGLGAREWAEFAAAVGLAA